MNRGSRSARGLESAGPYTAASEQQGWHSGQASIWDHLEPGMYQ